MYSFRGTKLWPSHTQQFDPPSASKPTQCTLSTAEHPEPPFIPKLQSRFADFPWSCSLLTRGFSPWRPDAVIGTEPALRTTHFEATPEQHAPDRNLAFWLWELPLRLRRSAVPRALAGHEVPGRRSGVNELYSPSPSMGRPAGMLTCFPFDHCGGCRRPLRSESPAVSFSGCGSLLLFSGLHADY